MYDLSDYNIDIPKKMIAQKPLTDRTLSKLMVLDRSTGNVKTGRFTDIVKFFKPGDVLVVNETQVIPARLFGKCERNGKKIEILVLNETEENLWEIMLKPGKSIRGGDKIVLNDGAECLIQSGNSNGNRFAVFECNDDCFYSYLDKHGKVPLPPYIDRNDVDDDKKRYQTVYAKVPGAVAAPTAGLHFTDDLLNDIRNAGVHVTGLTLHVGAGTFAPVRTKNIKDHKMHSEYYEINEQSADIINTARANGGKIFAVGTTTVRTLETVSDEKGFVKAGKGRTDIFIYPGYRFRSTDHLITNFHLPQSTLILLVSAFSSTDMIKSAYSRAVDENFRFYSYGDAMLII